MGGVGTRRRRRKLRRWVACLWSGVSRCAAGSLVGLVRVGLAVSLCDPHRAQTLGRNSNVPNSPPLALHVPSPHSPTLYGRSLSFILPRSHSTSLSSFPVLFKPSYNLFTFWISCMLHTSPALRILLDLIRLVAFGVSSYQHRCHERQKSSTA